MIRPHWPNPGAGAILQNGESIESGLKIITFSNIVTPGNLRWFYKSKNSKVFEYTFLAMVDCAQALGADELRVMHPVNADVKRYYESFGLSYTRGV